MKAWHFKTLGLEVFAKVSSITRRCFKLQGKKKVKLQQIFENLGNINITKINF